MFKIRNFAPKVRSMQYGVIFVVHPVKDIENLTNIVYTHFDRLFKKVSEDIIVRVVTVDKRDLVESTVRELAQTCIRVIVAPLLVLRGTHYETVREIVSKVRNETGREIDLLPPLLEQEDVIRSLVASIIRRFGELADRLREMFVISATGDLSLFLEIEMNRSIDEIVSAAAHCRDIVVDDIRVLTYVDTRYLRPGTRIYLEEDISRFSYSPGSIVVIASRIEALPRVLSLVSQGITPSLIIATPPCASDEEVQLKRKLLELNVPVVISSGFRGGVHVAGTILNTIMSCK